MKFVDLINEDFTPNEKQLKEVKNAKAVFASFRNGSVIYMYYSNGNKPTEDNVVKYKLGEPEYNWYPKNGYKDNMELTVVVKNMTVYIKDPVLYDAIVVNPDRMRNHYGLLIYNGIIPKAERKFEQHGVKLHISESKVEFVLVEPKKPEEINEEYTPEELKKIKSIRAVFFAHKKGLVTIRFNSPKTRETRDVVIGYKLGEPKINWNTFENKTKESWVTSEDITVYIKDPELYNTVIDSSALARGIVRGYVYPKMIRIFSKYRINYMPEIEPKAEFVLVEPKETKDPEQINEDPTVGEQNRLTDKEMKNFKALWASYKEGVFKYNDKKYKYELKNEYDVFKMPTTEYASSRIVALINGTFESSIRVYEMQDNGHNVLLDYGLENRLYSLVKAKVKKNFAAHNVHLHL